MSGKNLLNDLSAGTPLISVGVISADLMNLTSNIAALRQAGVELLHFDVMDGVFCPMMTVGPGFVKGIKSPLLKDVHLMIEEPLNKVEAYVAAGADMITIHAESTRYVHRVLQILADMTNVNDPARGVLRGVALNPGTPLEVVKPLLDDIEMVFLLAINPGWGGQKMIGDRDRQILIGVDGGITGENIGDVARMGADIIVTGSAVFRGGTPLENARSMMQTVKNAAGGPA